MERNRISPTSFTRKRQLPFHSLILFLMNMNNGSYQTELDNFFKAVSRLDVAERVVNKSSLSKARKKLLFDAFIELNNTMTAQFYSSFQFRSWYGFNLMAVDGTTLRVPDEPEIVEHFGFWNVANGKRCPKARASQMFDVLNKITIDAIISPKAEGERELAAFHFLKLMPTDLVLLDRGYPAFWLFKLILSMDANFCARISCTKWKVVRKFYLSGKKEAIVTLHPATTSFSKCKEPGLDKKTIKVRLVRVTLDTGETEVLITSLTDMDKHPVKIFANLYHLRRPVEEDYKTIKCRLQVENFSGKTTLSVYQDFHAKILSKNLTAVISLTVKDEINRISEQRKFEYQINFAQALSKMKHSIVLLFIRPMEIVQTMVSKLQKIFIQTIERIRPGRKHERNHKVKHKKFHFAYKTVS
ncbi:MAG: IS4 family transposase [Deltaproteobacteria bacterium]|nr:IS4 family transposase [Deltaproteobacteria bacterium]